MLRSDRGLCHAMMSLTIVLKVINFTFINFLFSLFFSSLLYNPAFQSRMICMSYLSFYRFIMICD